MQPTGERHGVVHLLYVPLLVAWPDMEGLVASVYLVWSALLVLYWLWCMHGCVDLATAV